MCGLSYESETESHELDGFSQNLSKIHYQDRSLRFYDFRYPVWSFARCRFFFIYTKYLLSDFRKDSFMTNAKIYDMLRVTIYRIIKRFERRTLQILFSNLKDLSVCLPFCLLVYLPDCLSASITICLFV